MNNLLPVSSIKLLSRQLANQIAAGEVVDRPASILKELLENSLDAGATDVEIDVERGGVKRILVRDNGFGIAADELKLAISRHATSKISTLEDLENIVSMGFRGEALASISSVSQMRITSRQSQSEQAWSLPCGDADHPTDKLEPASHPVGTSVETRDLFYNTPARRKFLRSERTEYRHLEDVVRRVALSHFNTAFTFRHNQRQVFRLPVAPDMAAKERRISRLCGKTFLQQASYLDFNGSDMHLWGWVLPPEYSRSQADLQFFFVNGRIIRDRVIAHALRQAYGSQLHPGRHPAYVLYFSLNPATVDVNVHPTKHEVRFHEARMVHDFLAHSLMDTFRQARASVIGTPKTYIKPAEGNVPHTASDSSLNTFTGINRVQETSTAYHPVATENVSRVAVKQIALPTSEQFITVAGNYAIARSSSSEQLLLIDIKMAQSHLLAKRLNEYYQHGAVRQPLLFPLSIPVKTDQAVLIQNELFGRLGFDFVLRDSETLQLRHIPAVLNNQDISQVLPLLFNELSGPGKNELDFSSVINLLVDLIVSSKTQANEGTSQLELEKLVQETDTRSNECDYVKVLDEATLASLFNNTAHD
ncbi:MAG: DNA mismatch repair endonuclease MutL [Gammaproteobacteria bacterium]|nr:DNA mismatch repair endonuclease MutL [Gammaproteobacteria bacterium]